LYAAAVRQACGACGLFSTLVSFGPSSKTKRTLTVLNASKGGEKEVDEHLETLDNLASLLLTNKTIRKRSKAVPNTVL
jgi:hypothetical protein